MGVSTGDRSQYYQRETFRYVAPERIEDNLDFYWIANPSKGSDVYSFAMTSFSVCTLVVNHLTT